ncbi:MAG: low molecular weight protein arginine phosphatase [Desulfocucumaceae bacterium]
MRVLFVCTGNTCRSSMAQAITMRRLKQKGVFSVKVFSAGTYTVSGLPASGRAIIAMKESGLDLEQHRSKVLDREMVKEADLVITMTGSHSRSVLGMCPEAVGKVFTLTEYVGLKGDVMDPFGGDLEVYRRVADQLESMLGLAVDRMLAPTSH